MPYIVSRKVTVVEFKAQEPKVRWHFYESKENDKLFSKILKTVKCWASEVITLWSALCKDYSNTLDTILRAKICPNPLGKLPPSTTTLVVLIHSVEKWAVLGLQETFFSEKLWIFSKVNIFEILFVNKFGN